VKLYLGGACAAALIGGFAFTHAAAAPAAPAAAAKTVQIQMFKFHPSKLVVKAGTRVTWVNKDGDPHTVKSANGHFASSALDTGKRFSIVLRHRGTFKYICTIHPYMHGTVVVR
jgi:plastocyanin